MQPVAYLTLLLAASAVASASQPEQVQNSPIAQSQPSVVVESHHQQVQPQAPSNVVVESHQVQPQHPSVASYYSPAGMIQVVGSEQQASGNSKPPQAAVGGRSYEQYGQPESAALPPNYKPFGSWGLYIGGNPADGYYTNYYKALSNSVADKQPATAGVEQPAAAVKPVAGGVSQTAALSPLLRQASSSPYVGGDYFPFAYSPSDLNSAARVAVEPIHASQVPALSPVQAGAQVYGSPAVFDSNSYGVSSYADAYATKKVGAAYAQKEATRDVPVVQQPAKGYQSRVYVYPSVGPMAAPSVLGHQQQPQVHQSQAAQVVAYPVPIGSQIVGSQAGIDGAFAPYGVHAFTRYAVKPTVVSQDSSYYYGVQQPTYRQHQQVYQPASASYYPLGGYYGYPLSQLHYSQGSLFPASIQGNEPHHVSAQPQFDGVVVEKAESVEDKNKQQ